MKKRFFAAVFAFLILLMPMTFVAAQSGTSTNKDLTIEGQLKDAGKQAFNIQTPKTPAQIVGQVIQVVLSFLGIAATGLVIYGGFLWLTARGNDEVVKKARGIIVNAIIGLIIIMSAYAITNFVVTQLQRTTQIGG